MHEAAQLLNASPSFGNVLDGHDSGHRSVSLPPLGGRGSSNARAGVADTDERKTASLGTHLAHRDDVADSPRPVSSRSGQDMTPAVAPLRFRALVERLAKDMHEQWAQGHFKDGWRFAPTPAVTDGGDGSSVAQDLPRGSNAQADLQVLANSSSCVLASQLPSAAVCPWLPPPLYDVGEAHVAHVSTQRRQDVRLAGAVRAADGQREEGSAAGRQ